MVVRADLHHARIVVHRVHLREGGTVQGVRRFSELKNAKAPFAGYGQKVGWFMKFYSSNRMSRRRRSWNTTEFFTEMSHDHYNALQIAAKITF